MTSIALGNIKDYPVSVQAYKIRKSQKLYDTSVFPAYPLPLVFLKACWKNFDILLITNCV